MLKKLRNHPLYKPFISILIVFCLIILWQVSKGTIFQPSWIIQQDFTHIWSAGHLNLLGENPYDPERVLQIKNEIAGSIVEQEVVSLLYTPPWTIPLPMVLSVLPYSLSRIFWLVLNIILWLVSALWLWRIYGGSTDQRWVALIVAFTFTPVFFIFLFGQVSVLVAIGIIGFIDQIENHENDWLAGLFASFITIKPQLFYLFWPALLVWVIVYKRWKVLISLGLIIIGSTLLGVIFNPSLIPQYIHTIINFSPAVWFTPTIGGYMRFTLGWDKFWLQFVPSILGLLWLIYYWVGHRESWRWSREMPLLVIVSIITMSYGWTYDYVLLLVAIIPAIILLIGTKRKKLAISLVLVLLGTEIAYLILHRWLNDEYFGWFAPFLIIWCLTIWHLSKSRFSIGGFRFNGN